MDAAEALKDLTEVSSQIEGAVIAEAGGALLASSFDGDRGERVAAAARALLAAAEESPAGSGRAGLTHLVARTGDGAVFVVRSGERFVAAVTDAEPTAGLVAYDLKTCLRLVDEGPPKPARKSSSRRSPPKRKPAASGPRKGGSGA